MTAVSGRAAWLGAGSFVLWLASAASPDSAHACTGIACFPGTFYLEPETVLPANTVALRWRPPNDTRAHAVAPVPHVTRVDGTPQEQAIEIAEINGYKVVRILQGFVPGGRYRLWSEGDQECLAPPIEIVAGPAAPLPEQLGRTLIGDPTWSDVTVPIHSSPCDTQIPAVSVAVDLELAAETKPWAALLIYTFRVDAKPWSYVPSYTHWPPLSDAGIVAADPAHTTVFAQCPGDPENGGPLDPNGEFRDLKSGTHQVVIEASLPGVVTALASDALELMLECKPAAKLDAGTTDGGRDARADAGSSARDHVAEGIDGGRPSSAARAESNAGGCAIHAAGIGRGAAPSFGWLLCALALLPLRARSRRRITG